MTIALADITKEQFQAYVRVQKSGATNMFAVSTVEDLSGLDKDTILAIIKNYSYLNDTYPDVRES